MTGREEALDGGGGANENDSRLAPPPGSSLDMDGPGPPTDRELVTNRNFHFPFPPLSPILFNLKTGGSPLKSTACAIRLSSKKIKHRINTK